jgi:formylglycine-generating enzyme required for sulfatase activity
MVATKAANELGIYDMSGNVIEWCSDWWGLDYYSTSPENNPQGPATGSARVYRGGGWSSNTKICRVARRGSNGPDYSTNDTGFRLVLALQSK